jgi:hypothetical protein
VCGDPKNAPGRRDIDQLWVTAVGRNLTQDCANPNMAACRIPRRRVAAAAAAPVS